MTGPTRRLPAGLVGALAILVLVESTIARQRAVVSDPAAFAWGLGERDARLRAIGADVLCFGDSLMKHGLLPEVIESRLGLRAYNLAVPAAQAPTSATLLRRALDAGARPAAILVDFAPDLLSAIPRDGSRYWPEVLTLGEVVGLARSNRSFGFLAETCLDLLLPSRRSRWEIRSHLLDALRGRPDPLRLTNLTLGRNWAIHRGGQFTIDNPAFDGTLTEAHHARFVSDRFWPTRVNREHVHRFLSLAESRGIPVYWLLPPVSPALQARRASSGADAKYSRFVAEVASAHPGVVVLDARDSAFDHTRFVDPIHLTGKGALTLTTLVADAIASRPGPWVALPPFREVVPPAPLEDVEQSRVAVLSGAAESQR